MRRSFAVFVAAWALLIAATAVAQWTREGDLCVNEKGETFDTGYESRSYITAICNTLNKFEAWQAAMASPPVLGGGPGGIPGEESPEEPAGENSAPVWSVTDQDLENGQAFSLTLNTVNTDADGDARNYTLSSGSLPTGLSLSSGVISGTPSADGDFTFVLGADDGRTTTLADAITTTAPLSFASQAFTPAQNGIFTVEFEVTPVASNIDFVVGIGSVTATGYGDLLAAVRFNTAGAIDARDNAAYAADNAVSYTGSSTYDVRMVLNVPASTYDVSVDDGGGYDVIGDDFVFRGAATPSTLGFITGVDASNPGTVGSQAGPFMLIQPVLQSVTWTVFTADMTAPDAPDPPTITGVTDSTVSMSLPASAAMDHANYDIYRSPSGCASYALIQDAYTGSTFTDTGRSADTGYCYRLVDVDTSGNESDPSTDATATTSAVDIDALLSMANVSANEGDMGTTNFTFVLTASSSQSFNIVCNYATADGTADSATDFTAASGTVQIDASATTENIVIVVSGDETEESTETFQVVVSDCGEDAPSEHATEHTATGSIVDDDTVGDPVSEITYERDGTSIAFSVSCPSGCQSGTYADGWSQWVAPIVPGESVTITAITPATTGSGSTRRNGAMADPDSITSQGFSGVGGSYLTGITDSLNITLPYVTTPATLGRPRSVIKSISAADATCTGSGTRQCFTMFEVLTIVESDPGNVFRPAWYGTTKTSYSAASFDSSFLSSVAAPSGGMSWDDALDVFRSVNMMPLLRDWNKSQGMSANINQQITEGYHAYITARENSAVMKLAQEATGDDVAKKEQLAKFVTQRGIDLRGIMTSTSAQIRASGAATATGTECAPWIGIGGFNGGRFVPILFMTHFLDQSAIRTSLNSLMSTQNGRACFAETGYVQQNPDDLGKAVPTFGLLTTTLYSASCAGSNSTCASVNGSDSASFASYDGLTDIDRLAEDYNLTYMRIQAASWLGGALAVWLTPTVRDAVPANAQHWLDWMDRTKRAGDDSAANEFGTYSSRTTNAVDYGTSTTYLSSGAVTWWTSVKDCHADDSCTGMNVP